MSINEKRNVAVVVLGDIGRSPRMQYHAESLLKSDFNVDIVGYGETKPLNSLLSHNNISIHNLKPFPTLRVPKIMNYILKTLWQSLCLLITLFYKRRSHYLICQNPPAIPTLYICWFYCLVVRAKFIIDWHNYAHTIMALSLHSDHKLVKLASFIESYFGSLADAHLCVTKSMKFDLKKKWRIRATTLYDRPQECFKSITLLEKHSLFVRLAEEYPALQSPEGTNVFTSQSADVIEPRTDRPGLLVSSTSWTEDEDFDILLNVLQDYDNSLEENRLPRLICVITGKGPLKDQYCKKIEELDMKNVIIITPWLEAQDYPLLLASADLGVCLHTSSSGLDLPMKVVDMFGCGLPVCAVKFKCLSELVKHGKNGYIFKDHEQLKEQIFNWFRDFPNNEEQIKIEVDFKDNLKEFQKHGWEENWKANALPLFN